MAIEQKNAIHAAGSVVGATGALLGGTGATSSRFALGIYDLVVLAIDETECQILCSRRGTALRTYFSVAHTSDTSKRVTIVDSAGAALDTDFDFVVLRTAG